jgi:hypothetical protein
MNEGPMIFQTVDNSMANWKMKWIRNAYLNGLRSPAIKPLSALPDDDRESIVICGSGPSLMKDIERLKVCPSIIVANHSNLATLLYFDIWPDFVIVADANEAIAKRLRPVFANLPRLLEAKFILPTHCPPALVDVLEAAGQDMYFYPNIARKPQNSSEMDFYNDVLRMLTPSLDRLDEAGVKVQDCLVQAGCVTNAALIFSMYLIESKAKGIREIYFSGCDFSYPDGKARCPLVVYGPESHEPELVESPDFDPTPERYELNGLLTDDNQFAYYRDLRFIVSVMRQDFPDVAHYTTTWNFISDFLPIKPL